MSKGVKILLIVLGIIAVCFIILFSTVYGTYNKLIALEESVNASWAQVENQLQRRYDLIPNLVETVKGYASHEEEVLTRVTEARASVGKANSIGEKIDANQELSSALSRLMVVVENYPNLKANQNFIRLQDELAGTENRIAVERRRYNEAVKNYNIKARSFPSNIIANIFGFELKTMFEATAEAQEAPKVQF